MRPLETSSQKVKHETKLTGMSVRFMWNLDLRHYAMFSVWEKTLDPDLTLVSIRRMLTHSKFSKRAVLLARTPTSQLGNQASTEVPHSLFCKETP